MESDTTIPRKGMTFITPRLLFLQMEGLSRDSPIRTPWYIRPLLSLVPWKSAGGFSSQGASVLSTRPRVESQQDSSKYPLPASEVPGKFLKTCSLFMSLLLGSLPLLISSLDVALFNIGSIFPPLPPSMFRACQGSCHWG